MSPIQSLLWDAKGILFREILLESKNELTIYNVEFFFGSLCYLGKFMAEIIFLPCTYINKWILAIYPIWTIPAGLVAMLAVSSKLVIIDVILSMFMSLCNGTMHIVTGTEVELPRFLFWFNISSHFFFLFCNNWCLRASLPRSLLKRFINVLTLCLPVEKKGWVTNCFRDNVEVYFTQNILRLEIKTICYCSL